MTFREVFTLRFKLLLLLVVSGAVSGCESGPTNYERLGIAQASGRVTLDGEPLVAARIVFVEPGAGFASVGETDSEGKYQLMLNSTQPGVAPGKKVVRIMTGYAQEEGELAGVETLPKRYNKDSELSAEVKPGETHVFDFDLTSEGEVEQPVLETGEDG